VDLRHIKNIWLRGNTSDCTSSTAAERSDAAPSQRVIKTRVGGEREWCNGGEQYRQTRNKKSYTWHMGAESSAEPCWSARRPPTLALLRPSGLGMRAKSLLPVKNAAVDFSVIYGNIAALFAMSDADLRSRIKDM